MNETIALDSVRHYDNNNHLIVDRTVITKAAVNPYLGSSIPRWQELGLDPNREYNLLRDPDELRRSLDTFKSLQLLIRHIPVDASEPEKESTIGSIGSVLEMDEDGRVWSSLRVFDQEGINYIESKELGELSAGYAYDAVMKSGTFNGVPYDGIMTNIHGNHVAIVERGRIGSDAIIADSIEGQLMASKIKLKHGGLAKLQKALGMDSADEAKKTIMAVHAALALDSDKEEKAEDEKDEQAEDEEVEIVEDSEDDKKAKDEQTQADKDNESEAMRLKEREKREEKDRTRDKEQAQDAAIEQRTVERITKLFEAREKVKPIVGVIACDSAEEVYKTALKHVGIALDGIHPSAYGAMVDMHLSRSSNIAMDSASKPALGKLTENAIKFLNK